MKTVQFNVTFTHKGREHTRGFVRPSWAKTPTNLGAARMVLSSLKVEFPEHPFELKDISVLRVETILWRD